MVDQRIKYVVEEIDSAYSNYLAQLKERNRQKQIIQQKSEEILRRERLEQGFQLYFNIFNTNHKLKSTNLRFNPERSRSLHGSNEQETHRTKSAPNLAKQRRRRKAWGEINGLDMHIGNKTSSNSDINLNRLGTFTSDRGTSKVHNCCPEEFPFPSTKNMRCRPKALQSDSSVDEIVCLDKDETVNTTEVKACAENSSEMTDLFELQLDIYSNWGDKNWVGLSGLELGDSDLAQIVHFRIMEVLKLNLDRVPVRPATLFHEQHLFTEPFQTTDPRYMCFSSVDNLPLRINIKCFVGAEDRIDQKNITLRLWNYNDPKFPDIGVRDCCVKLKSNNRVSILFNGVLDRISDGQLTDHPKVIDCNFKSEPRNGHGKTDDKNAFFESNKQLSYDNVVKQTDAFQVPPTPKSCQFLRKVDPFLNDSEDMLPLCSLRQTTSEPVKPNGSRIRSLLEESWNSLKFFNHFHAGRINVCKQNSVQSSIAGTESLSTSEVMDELRSSSQFVPNHENAITSKSNEPRSFFTPVHSENLLTEKISKHKILCPERISEPVTIPTLPFGYTLIIDIISTWGDIYYVGLTGIEIFTMDGTNIAPFCRICADPADINILPGYNEDPRVITNLIDGINWTRDDIHMWLAPFSKGSRHLIQIQLPSWTKPIALMRIWNYNKSRVHASRGAREILIYLDAQPIFHGEISKASGLELGEPEDFSETILFCTDNDILEQIGKNDDVMKARNLVLHDMESITGNLDERPKTSVQQEVKSSSKEKSMEAFKSNDSMTGLLENLNLNDRTAVEDSWVEIELLKPWKENASFIGLTGIQILDSTLAKTIVTGITINDVAVDSNDPVHRLFNDNRNTNSLDEMWSIEFNESRSPKLRIHVKFNSSQQDLRIIGMKLWNYNDPHVETDYSCKLIRIRDCYGSVWKQNTDSDMILLRRGPGHTRFPFGQLILSTQSNNKDQSRPHYDVESEINNHIPSGFVYQLSIFSSWYDQFYVGLNGLALIGLNGESIKIEKNQIFAYPCSVNELHSNPNRLDIRTVDKLIDDYNEGTEMSYHCWLAPILPDRINQIYIVFDEPVSAIGLKLWNYTRTPERGVRELAVLLDNRLIYRGYLPKYRIKSGQNNRFFGQAMQGILSNSERRHDQETNQYYVIPFNQEEVEKWEDSNYILDSSKRHLTESGVKLINIDHIKREDLLENTESYLRSRSNINQTLRPTTCISNLPVLSKL